MHEVNVEKTSDFRSVLDKLYSDCIYHIFIMCPKTIKQTKTNITQKLSSSAFCKYLYLTSCYHKVKISGSVFTLFWSVSRFSGSVFILLLSVSTKRSGEGYSDYIEKKTNVFIALLKHPLKN